MTEEEPIDEAVAAIWDDAYGTGFRDGYEDGVEDGFDRGFLAGLESRDGDIQ